MIIIKPVERKISILLSIIGLFISISSFSKTTDTVQLNRAKQILENRGEVIVQFAKPVTISIDSITRLVSIDSYKNNLIQAYISKRQFSQFLKLGINFTVIEPS